jgi:hypothetical protein
MGDEQLSGDVNRCIGEAFRQIDRTEKLLAEDHPAFAAIPKDLPRRGVVSTLEPYWASTNPFFHRLIPTSLIPTAVASSRQLERAVAVSYSKGADALQRSLFENPAIREERDDVIARNPLLEAAWHRNPLSRSRPT